MATERASLPPRGRWFRFLDRLRTVAEAADLSYDEIQDRRILALEREVARLRGEVQGGGLRSEGSERL